ncbi:hypothetical protein GY45DRAFT_1111158 [Cubamyces sp. BRFM 1775]|nr:hypothetical protein GY45DRAFT_1111158 [Cubamyces sp. BRFM 1775]
MSAVSRPPFSGSILPSPLHPRSAGAFALWSRSRGSRWTCGSSCAPHIAAQPITSFNPNGIRAAAAAATAAAPSPTHCGPRCLTSSCSTCTRCLSSTNMASQHCGLCGKRTTVHFPERDRPKNGAAVFVAYLERAPDLSLPNIRIRFLTMSGHPGFVCGSAGGSTHSELPFRYPLQQSCRLNMSGHLGPVLYMLEITPHSNSASMLYLTLLL